MAIEVYLDPGLLGLDDEVEPDPEDAEVLTVAADGTVWWSAPVATDDEDSGHEGWCPTPFASCRCDILI
jgi:hypothetical protein